MNASERNIITIPQGIISAGGRYPGNTAFHYYREGWKTLTYKELLADVDAMASHLINSGLRPDDRVAIVSENRPEWCCAYLSIVRAGGIAVPIDPQLAAGETANLLRDSGSGIIFHSRKTQNNAESLRTAADEGQIDAVFINFDSPGYRSFFRTDAAEGFPGRGPEDVASIIYTSGTTGNPKGVMLTHANFCSDAGALIGVGLVSHDDNVLSVLPLHHTYAFMCTFLVPLLLGASITYPASLKSPDLMAAMQDNGVSVLIGVPQLLALIRNGIVAKIRHLPGPVAFASALMMRFSGFLRERYDVNIGRLIFSSARRAFGPRFRFLGSGGARLDPAVMKDLEAIGFTVLEGYGLTETSPVVTFNPMTRRKPGSAGRPLPSVELRIHDPAEQGEGEIEIRGPMVMKGYYRNPAATADVMHDGWLRTGDIGRIDDEGYLFITGRSKEVIVLSSGKNIYPEEVEKRYGGSPLIKELCVIGAEEEGESLHAVIVPDLEYVKAARISDIREAIKWEISGTSAKLPSYMRVTGFSIRTESLPRTPLGKLRRFLVQRELLSGRARPEEEEGDGGALRGEEPQKIGAELLRFVKEGRRISLDDNLELDLGLDSLAKVELVASLENTFSVKLREDFLANIRTVRELVDGVMLAAVKGYPLPASASAGWQDILFREPSEGDLEMISLERPESRMLPSFAAFSLLRLLFRACFRLEARGIEHLPKERNFIIVANHTSYLDGFAVILSLPFVEFKNLYSLGLSEYFAGPIKGGLARIAHVIPIDSAAYLSKALQMSAYVLREGRSLLVFPEGGRSADGTLLPFKKGVGVLAFEMSVPVVPAFIRGAFEALPKGASLPKCRGMTIAFGRPLFAEEVALPKEPAGIDKYQHFANILRARVLELAERGK